MKVMKMKRSMKVTTREIKPLEEELTQKDIRVVNRNAPPTKIGTYILMKKVFLIGCSAHRSREHRACIEELAKQIVSGAISPSKPECSAFISRFIS